MMFVVIVCCLVFEYWKRVVTVESCDLQSWKDWARGNVNHVHCDLLVWWVFCLWRWVRFGVNWRFVGWKDTVCE